MLEEAFKSGELLLPATPGEVVAQASEGTPLLMSVLVVVFVLCTIAMLPSFLYLLPALADSVFRARGSSSLEHSVRLNRDRTLIALMNMIPAVLLVYRYRLYNPSFLCDLAPTGRLLAIAAVFLGYLLLRGLLYQLGKPRRRSDYYRQAHRGGFTFFILLMFAELVTVGILFLFGCNDVIIRHSIYVELLIAYAFYLFRRTQILSLSCNPLTTFLYLCTLEILPTALLIISAVIL